MDEACREAYAGGTPFLGVCVGLQVLFEGSVESLGARELGIPARKVVRFEVGALQVPHMGWNQLDVAREHPVLDGLDGEAFYFVHSYYPDPAREDDLLGTADYGARFCAAAGQNLAAVQFHPEKSSRAGLKLYENFLGGRGAPERFHGLSRHRPARRQMRAPRAGGLRAREGVRPRTPSSAPASGSGAEPGRSTSSTSTAPSKEGRYSSTW